VSVRRRFRAGLLLVAVLAPAARAGEAERELRFREGRKGKPHTTWDAQIKEASADKCMPFWFKFPVGSSGPGKERRSLIRWPHFMGAEPGQVPYGARVTKATLRLTPLGAGEPVRVSAWRIVEPWTYTPISNQKNLAPAWAFRRNGKCKWRVPGCGYEDGARRSREREPVGSVEVGAGAAPVEIDVTRAVRHWTRRPSENWGLLVAADAGQRERFFGSSDHNEQNMRPELVVRYLVAPDTEGPALELTKPERSPTQYVWLEGAVGPDAGRVLVRIEGEEAREAERLSPLRFLARLELPAAHAERATELAVTVTATDAAGNRTERRTVARWTPLPIEPGDEAYAIGLGESLRLALPPGAARAEVRLPDGRAIELGAPGRAVSVRFGEPGVKELEVALFDAAGAGTGRGVQPVHVVEVRPPENFALHYFGTKTWSQPATYWVGVRPANSAGRIVLQAADPDALYVEHRGPWRDRAIARAAPQHMGEATVLARLGSARGRVLARGKVLAFAVTYRELRFPRGGRPGSLRVRLQPFKQWARVNLRFGEGTTFTDGPVEKTLAAKDFDEDGTLRVEWRFPPKPMNDYVQVILRVVEEAAELLAPPAPEPDPGDEEEF